MTLLVNPSEKYFGSLGTALTRDVRKKLVKVYLLQKCVKGVLVLNWILIIFHWVTAWKVSKYEVSLRIQSECQKIRTRNNSVFGRFSRSVNTLFTLMCTRSGIILGQLCKSQSQPAIKCSKSTIETLEQCGKSINFEQIPHIVLMFP